jgi:hypothetical protein
MFYLAVLPTFLLLVYSDAEDVFREDPLGKGIDKDFMNRGWYECGADIIHVLPYVNGLRCFGMGSTAVNPR